MFEISDPSEKNVLLGWLEAYSTVESENMLWCLDGFIRRLSVVTLFKSKGLYNRKLHQIPLTNLIASFLLLVPSLLQIRGCRFNRNSGRTAETRFAHFFISSYSSHFL